MCCLCMRCFAACTPTDRELFNNNILEKFAKEARLTQANNLTFARAAEWKFRQLDRDSDLMLESREYKDLKRLIKRLVEPRPCARNFIKFTDRDSNEIITTHEWMNSLGVDGADGWSYTIMSLLSRQPSITYSNSFVRSHFSV